MDTNNYVYVSSLNSQGVSVIHQGLGISRLFLYSLLSYVVNYSTIFFDICQ